MKQVILVRSDLKMPKGKLAAQACHAAVGCVLESDKRKISLWSSEGMKKVVLKVFDKKELFFYRDAAKKAGLVTYVVSDAGRTFFSKSTVTCMGIGPDMDDVIDRVTRSLAMI